ncbi:hypothetical protein E8E01_15100 [Methylorubrum populi]|jgi:hypothetical protein|uniref:DUF6522 family protein n=1 Tax=Methylorubrum populi TaxID=223967 RepID=UPI0011512267|nr:DUF6522 family protein [Methylorubrum populi]QDI81678.1 hypothetical protein E8E01_15100 [Methylorubrum populi]
MRFDRDSEGAWIIDPADLAVKLGMTSAQLQSQERRGLVGSRVEIGSGSDEGRSRVTVTTEYSGWQGLFDVCGALIGERFFEPGGAEITSLADVSGRH